MANRFNSTEDPTKWNDMAKPCSSYPRRSDYADAFLKMSGIEPGDTVFDMGCGSGTLCLPLSDDGHRVFGGDFSEKMLASVQDVIEEEGIELITLQKMSFLDDWDQYDIPVCDMVFASRCLFDLDPKIVLPKLTSKAGKRVCITLHVSFRDVNLSGSLIEGNDSMEYFKACFGTVIDMGYFPKVDYLPVMFEDRRGWAFMSWDVNI